MKKVFLSLVCIIPQLVWADLDDFEEKKPPASNVAPTPPAKAPPNLDNKQQNVLDLDKPANEAEKPQLPPAPSPPPANRRASPLGPGAPGSDQHDSRAPIQWKAKGFKGSRNGQQIELKEDVVVTQENMTLYADTAKLFFNIHNEVEKVEAKGNVKVTKSATLEKDRIAARGNEAVFYNAERKVTLKGKASIVRGGDVVRGKQITYDLDSGWISVDRVEGVVQPGEKTK